MSNWPAPGDELRNKGKRWPRWHRHNDAGVTSQRHVHGHGPHRDCTSSCPQRARLRALATPGAQRTREREVVVVRPRTGPANWPVGHEGLRCGVNLDWSCGHQLQGCSLPRTSTPQGSSRRFPIGPQVAEAAPTPAAPAPATATVVGQPLPRAGSRPPPGLAAVAAGAGRHARVDVVGQVVAHVVGHKEQAGRPVLAHMVGGVAAIRCAGHAAVLGDHPKTVGHLVVAEVGQRPQNQIEPRMPRGPERGQHHGLTGEEPQAEQQEPRPDQAGEARLDDAVARHAGQQVPQELARMTPWTRVERVQQKSGSLVRLVAWWLAWPRR